MIIVTGAAGFIGFHCARALLDRGEDVVGVDNFNDYYDPALKEARAERLAGPRFELQRIDLADAASMAALFARVRPARVLHLAAQAGVRYSIENPRAYVDSNVVGFLNILEGCRAARVEHLVYASSSSVYGATKEAPFREDQNVDHPISLYAATKKANELMAHTYSHLYGMPTTGLRYFTVYGPWGRPDMAPYNFTKAIFEERPIPVYNEGRMIRDFTYIDDVVEGTMRVLAQPPAPTPTPYRIYNIGNHQPVELLHYIEVLETAIGKKAKMELLPMQPGDVPMTLADTTRLTEAVGFAPSTPVEEGVRRLVAWYREYYGV